MAYLRKFNVAGIAKFSEELQRIRNEKKGSISNDLIFSPKYSEEFNDPNKIKIDKRDFSNKKDFVAYFHPMIKNIGPEIYYDEGLWTWLSAFYFESTTPEIKGLRRVTSEVNYVLQEVKNYQRYYRHYLASPCRIFYITNGNPMFLKGPLGKPGEIYEQLGSRLKVISNLQFLQAAYKLYWDSKNDEFKKGARSKGKGSVRRLAYEIHEQFSKTYDFASMDPDDIIDMMPPEFDQFK